MKHSKVLKKKEKFVNRLPEFTMPSEIENSHPKGEELVFVLFCSMSMLSRSSSMSFCRIT